MADNREASGEKKEKISGSVSKIIFRSPETGYVVGRLKNEESKGITFAGNLSGIVEDERIELHGYWSRHPKWGRQFRVESFTADQAHINGIGPGMAGRIVKTFGSAVIEIIKNSPERLGEIEGIGKKRIETIRAAWEAHRATREVVLFLQSIGISPSYASRICKKYGDEAVKVIRENPYQLALDISGIGFLAVDKIARRLGVSLDSPLRVQSGVIFALAQHTEQGHMFCPLQDLFDLAGKELEIEDRAVKAALPVLAKRRNK
ncbi:MAG TPA: hypothetical protein DCZ04_02295 [Syntrophorhabdus aromaticivorans]|nr:hypothetical protein [Syntrophorhabdus aromaticivorans]